MFRTVIFALWSSTLMNGADFIVQPPDSNANNAL